MARLGCDVFTHKSDNEEGASYFLLINLLKKKQVFLESKSLIETIRVLQRILTVFVKSKQLSTVSPNFR